MREPSVYNAAIGEALERYCGHWVSAPVIKASYNELKARGQYAIDPEKLVLYSESQYNAKGFPFVPFARSLSVHWIEGRSLSLDRTAWIPANIVYGNPYSGPCKGERPTNHIFYPGLAAGANLEHALTADMEEVIERHATMTWWLNRQPLPKAVLPSRLSALWEGMPSELGQRASAVYLENEFGVPVMAGVLENVEEKLFNIGFAARPDPVEGVLKAWTEALTLQESSRDLLDPDGVHRQAIARDRLSGRFIKPWRYDRRYLDDYRRDFRDMSDLVCQQQLFLDPRAREVVRPWIDVASTKSIQDIPRLKDRTVASYRKALEDRGYEIFYVDVTLPDVALTGIKVVKVVVPGLVANFPAAFPLLGKGVIQDAAVRLGWRQLPLKEQELNYFPLPHA